MGSVLLINIHTKVWRPKMVNKYTHVEYSSDVDEGVFDFKQYGKAIFRTLPQCEDIKRDYIILYSEAIDKSELYQHIRI